MQYTFSYMGCFYLSSDVKPFKRWSNIVQPCLSWGISLMVQYNFRYGVSLYRHCKKRARQRRYWFLRNLARFPDRLKDHMAYQQKMTNYLGSGSLFLQDIDHQYNSHSIIFSINVHLESWFSLSRWLLDSTKFNHFHRLHTGTSRWYFVFDAATLLTIRLVGSFGVLRCSVGTEEWRG